ncbi:MAG: FkbM family methyltransferase, partial [Tagaea sp.]|nr:FkbM family methyltransferase [Tagaea sp.]
MTRTTDLRRLAILSAAIAAPVPWVVAPPEGIAFFAVATPLLWAGARWGLADHPFARLGAANAVTYVRGMGVALLCAFLTAPLDERARLAFALFAGLLLAADGLDGWLARRNRTASAFGARFDMEVDSALMLVLSILAARAHGIELLLLGLPRYVFVAASFAWPFLSNPLPHSERRRIVCVVQGLGLIAAIAPWDPGAWLAGVALAALLGSFALDVAWLWRHAASRRRENGFAPYLGLARSIAIYWLVPGRRAKLDRLYARWVKPGGLAFDVGSHAGNRAASWRRLGAAVVAVEPQPLFADFLARLFVDDPNFVLERAAIGAREGTLTLRVSDRHPTVTSASGDFVAAAARAPGYERVVWNHAVDVPMTTLDALIARHGRPDFVKIDVEGAEAEVLAGLNSRVPALSFEYAWASKDTALACVERLAGYRFNRSIGESLEFVSETWMDARALRDFLEALTPGDPS